VWRNTARALEFVASDEWDAKDFMLWGNAIRQAINKNDKYQANKLADDFNLEIV
jgi:hypothetical protein